MTDSYPIVLTPSDFAVLENLVHNWGEPFAGAAELIRHKLSVAALVLPADVPVNIVTLNSRVRFRAGTGRAQDRIIVAGPSEAVNALALPLASPRGVALIGAAVGQVVHAPRHDGSIEELVIEAVHHQPECKKSPTTLKIVSRQDIAGPRSLRPSDRNTFVSSRFGKDDDPGPSAA